MTFSNTRRSTFKNIKNELVDILKLNITDIDHSFIEYMIDELDKHGQLAISTIARKECTGCINLDAGTCLAEILWDGKSKCIGFKDINQLSLLK